MIDAFIDPETWDIPLNGKFVSGVDLVRQRIEILLRTNRGEWFLDTEFGIPWSEWATTKGLNIREAASLIRRKILDVDGVVRADPVTSVRDPNQRQVSFSGTAFASDGTGFAFSTSTGDNGFAGINGTHLTVVHIRPVGHR